MPALCDSAPPAVNTAWGKPTPKPQVVVESKQNPAPTAAASSSTVASPTAAAASPSSGGWGSSFASRVGTKFVPAEPTPPPAKPVLRKDVSTNLVMDINMTSEHIRLWDSKDNSSTVSLAEYHRRLRASPLCSRPLLKTELLRAELMEALRHRYQELCSQHLDWKLPPKESFNRWLCERHAAMATQPSTDGEYDPLVPGRVEPEVSPSLYRELLDDLPVKLRPGLPYVTEQAKAYEHLSTYLGAVSSLLAKHQGLAEDELAELNQRMRDTNAKCQVEEKLAASEVVEAIRELQAFAKPLLVKLMGPVVGGLVRELGVAAHEAAVKIAEQAKAESSDENGDNGDDGDDGDDAVSVHKSDRYCELSYRRSAVAVNTAHYVKLRTLFYRHHPSTSDQPLPHPIASVKEVEKAFHAHLWLMLRRYKSYCGLSRFEGSLQQASVAGHVLRHLHASAAHVEMEGFASPLNAFFNRYGSAFVDADCVFGSVGSFFSLSLAAGAFVLTPPHSEELMSAMAARVLSLLSRSPLPLSFVVLLPLWSDPPSSASTLLAASAMVRAQWLLKPDEHQFIDGLQHEPDQHHHHHRSRLFKPVHATQVFVVSNDAGHELWTAGEEAVAAIKLHMTKKVCDMFATPQGCKLGERCQDAHDLQQVEASRPRIVNTANNAHNEQGRRRAQRDHKKPHHRSNNNNSSSDEKTNAKSWRR